MDFLSAAIELAAAHHAGQVDKAGRPYILHPLRVMASMESDIDKAVAILHDTIEDTSLTTARLRLFRFPEKVIQAVDCLTKREGEKYFDYIDRVSKNEIAVRVKIADLRDNMDKSRLNNWSEQDQKRQDKYQTALDSLLYRYNKNWKNGKHLERINYERYMVNI